jgi:hypothetical protein
MIYKLQIIFFVVLLILSGCSNMPDEPGKLTENLLPETELANTPPDDPSGNNPINPEITFYWSGNDPDGYIIKYKYRWCNIINKDTTWTEWHYISAIDASGNKIIGSNSVTLIMDSPDETNIHIFEVAAIDNMLGEDKSPALVRFCTRKGPAPETILTDFPPSENIVNDNITESWNGLFFRFSDIASHYSYKINNGLWSAFSDTNTITLTGKLFPGSGNYQLYFKAKNKYSVEDNTPLEFDVKIIKPVYTKDILLIDMTSNGIGVQGSPSDEEVDSFYDTICKDLNLTDDLWNFKNTGFPSRAAIANYKMVLIYSDNSYSDFDNKLFKSDIDILQDYLNTGGRLITSGWIPSNIFLSSMQADSFFYKYSQVKTGPETIHGSLPIKLNNLLNYPALRIDETKFPPSWSNTFDNIQIYSPRAFGETIYTLNWQSNANNGKAAIMELKTNTYKTVLSSLPLYYFIKDDVKSLFQKVIDDFK